MQSSKTEYFINHDFAVPNIGKLRDGRFFINLRAPYKLSDRVVTLAFVELWLALEYKVALHFKAVKV